MRDDSPTWSDICYTASVRREHHDCRLAVLANSREDAATRLEDFLNGRADPRPVGRKPYGLGLKVAFLSATERRLAAGLRRDSPKPPRDSENDRGDGTSPRRPRERTTGGPSRPERAVRTVPVASDRRLRSANRALLRFVAPASAPNWCWARELASWRPRRLLAS